MFKSPFRATHIARADGGLITITADDHEKITCSAAVLATGVKYRRLEALNIGPFIGRGVSYGSPMTDAGKWENAKVAIVGGANSAAQAAVFLGGCNNCDVHLIVRGDSLAKGMSQYLVDNIDKAPNITVHLDTEVEEVLGNRDTISGIKVRNKAGVSKQIRLNHLFVQIGATPHTAWLDGEIALDEHGFIITDRDLANEQWPLEDRRPFTFETSVPGIFAVGDNRLHSVKRASAAVGEGSGVVPNIHAYLAQLRGLNGTH
jgi:thioredoxin reductase (NADPH)